MVLDGYWVRLERRVEGGGWGGGGVRSALRYHGFFFVSLSLSFHIFLAYWSLNEYDIISIGRLNE